jgi:molybdenum cofactor cytidylyltransferase
MIAIVVLAAGRSSRMGAHKLLLPLGDRPVVAHSVGAALGSRLRPVIVVLGHEAARVRAVLPEGDLRVVENAAYADGMSTSLRAGIDALPEVASGAIVMLADQPLLSSDHLDRIADAAEASGAPIVVATYAGRRGNPVYFARELFAELRGVAGDEGGRAVIARHSAGVHTVEFGDPILAQDLDEPADYERVRAAWERAHK